MAETKEPDDEIEGGKMSFLDHLDELRRRLVNSAIAIFIFFLFAWAFSDRIYIFLERPVKLALRQANERLIEKGKTNAPTLPEEGKPYTYTFQTQDVMQGATIPAGSTAQAEYKKTGENQFALVTAQPWVIGNIIIPAGTPLPGAQATITAGSFGAEERLIIDTVAGGFSLYVRVSFYAAIFFAVPFLLYQTWAFIAPGLYAHEKLYAWPVILVGSFFFALGASFAYKIAFPRACDYLIGLSSENFRPLIKADDYFDIITTIVLGLGLVFQIPTLSFVLARIGLLTPRLILKFWRPSVIIIMLLAAVLSPTPDIPNMLVFAVPMLLLYFLSVGIAWVFGKGRRRPKESAEIAEVG